MEFNNTNFVFWHEEENEENAIAKDIEEAKSRYGEQKAKVENEIYIENLLYADFIRKCKQYKHRYDYVYDVMAKAYSQQSATKKKEKQDFLIMEEMLISDFFADYKKENPKLIEIISEGYENYAYNFYIECMGIKFCITIPVLCKVDAINFEYVSECKIRLYIEEKTNSLKGICFSYKIEDIAEAIKNYIETNKKEEN